MSPWQIDTRCMTLGALCPFNADSTHIRKTCKRKHVSVFAATLQFGFLGDNCDNMQHSYALQLMWQILMCVHYFFFRSTTSVSAPTATQQLLGCSCCAAAAAAAPAAALVGVSVAAATQATPAKQRDANKQCFRDLPQGCMHCLLAFANKQCFRDLPQGAEGCLHLHICMYLPEKRTHASKAVLRGSRCKVLQGMQGLGECRHLLGPPAAATRWAPAAAWVSVAP